MHHGAKENKPKVDTCVIKSLSDNTYVDDNLESAHTIEEDQKMVKAIAELWSSTDFHMMKWTSNEPEILSAVPERERALGVKVINTEKEPLLVGKC